MNSLFMVLPYLIAGSHASLETAGEEPLMGVPRYFFFPW